MVCWLATQPAGLPAMLCLSQRLEQMVRRERRWRWRNLTAGLDHTLSQWCCCFTRHACPTTHLAAVQVVQPSREADQLRGLLLTLIRQAMAPLMRDNVRQGAVGRRPARAFLKHAQQGTSVSLASTTPCLRLFLHHAAFLNPSAHAAVLRQHQPRHRLRFHAAHRSQHRRPRAPLQRLHAGGRGWMCGWEERWVGRGLHAAWRQCGPRPALQSLHRGWA